MSANKKKKNREREEYLNAHEYKLTSTIKKKVKELLGKRSEDDDAATPLRLRHNGAGGGRIGRNAARKTRGDEEQGRRRSSPRNDDFSDDEDIGDDSSGGNSSYDDNDENGDDVDEDKEGDENNAECDQSREGSVFEIKTPVISRKRDHVRPNDGRFGHGHGQGDEQWDGMEAGVEEQGLSPLHITTAGDQFLTTRREADKTHALSPVVAHQAQGSPFSENVHHDLRAAAITIKPDQDYNSGQSLAGGRGHVLLPSLHNHYAGGSTSKAAKDEAASDQRFTTTRDRDRESMRHPSNSTPTHRSPKDI